MSEDAKKNVAHHAGRGARKFLRFCLTTKDKVVSASKTSYSSFKEGWKEQSKEYNS